MVDRRRMIELLDGGRLFESQRLKILLDNAFPSGDNAAIADRLLKCFPCMQAILSASAAELAAAGLTDRKYADFLICAGKCCPSNARDEHISGAEQFCEMMKRELTGRDSELGAFYLVTKHGKIVKSEFFTSASADFVKMDSAEIFRLFSLYDFYGIYIAHNHVYGAAYPSDEDDEMTKKLKRLAEKCGVNLFDHVIVNARGESFSYALTGRLEEL